MADTHDNRKKISDLPLSTGLPTNSLLEAAIPGGDGFDSNAITPETLGNTILNEVEYESLTTESSTIIDAINEVKATSVELDTTLTERGMAADAKSVGDRFDNVTNKNLLFNSNFCDVFDVTNPDLSGWDVSSHWHANYDGLSILGSDGANATLTTPTILLFSSGATNQPFTLTVEYALNQEIKRAEAMARPNLADFYDTSIIFPITDSVSFVVTRDPSTSIGSVRLMLKATGNFNFPGYEQSSSVLRIRRVKLEYGENSTAIEPDMRDQNILKVIDDKIAKNGGVTKEYLEENYYDKEDMRDWDTLVDLANPRDLTVLTPEDVNMVDNPEGGVDITVKGVTRTLGGGAQGDFLEKHNPTGTGYLAMNLKNGVTPKSGSITSGSGNDASGLYAIIAGETNSSTTDLESTLVTGLNNKISGSAKAHIIAGEGNRLEGSQWSDIVSGNNNVLDGSKCTLVEGEGNTIYNTSYCSIVAGSGNTISNSYRTAVVAANSHLINSQESAVAGSNHLISHSERSSVSGVKNFVANTYYPNVSGDSNIVIGGTSPAVTGTNNVVSGRNATANGYGLKATGNYSHAEGYNNHISSSDVYGKITDVQEYVNRRFPVGTYSTLHVKGTGTIVPHHPFVVPSTSTVGGRIFYTSNTSNIQLSSTEYTEITFYPAIEITKTNMYINEWSINFTPIILDREFGATGTGSHSEGVNTLADNEASHAEGYLTESSGRGSHSEGFGTSGNGGISYSCIFGFDCDEETEDKMIFHEATTLTRGWIYTDTIPSYCSGYTHTNGSGFTLYDLATGAGVGGGSVVLSSPVILKPFTRVYFDLQIPISIKANSYINKYPISGGGGAYNLNEPTIIKATAEASHAEGFGTVANSPAQHVQGALNLLDPTKAMIIGNGSFDITTHEITRSNAMTVDWDGNVEVAGDVTSTDSEGKTHSLNDRITLEVTTSDGAVKTYTLCGKEVTT